MRGTAIRRGPIRDPLNDRKDSQRNETTVTRNSSPRSRYKIMKVTFGDKGKGPITIRKATHKRSADEIPVKCVNRAKNQNSEDPYLYVLLPRRKFFTHQQSRSLEPGKNNNDKQMRSEGAEKDLPRFPEMRH